MNAAASCRPVPPADPGRLAAALTALAQRVEHRDVRAQLHAVSAVLANLEPPSVPCREREDLEAAITRAIEAGDEERVLDGVRRLARLDRAAVRPVDWTAVSGG